MTRPQALRNGLSLAALVILLDQLIKYWITNIIMLPPRIIPVTPFFNLVLGHNRGVSFGFFDGNSPLNQWLLSFVALAITATLVIWLTRTNKPWVAVALGLIIGGAIGNVIDRLADGAVVDFLDFSGPWFGTYIGGFPLGFPWVFNIADAGITVGALLLFFDQFLMSRSKPEEHAPA